MSAKLIITDEAELEIQEAFDWYESQREALEAGS
jgi:hypothetical protein